MQNMLKITFALYRPGLSGGTRVACTYAERLAKRGHDVTLIFIGPDKPRFRERLSNLLFPTARTHESRLSPFVIKAGVPFREIADASALDDRHFPDADVVIANFWRTADWVAGLSDRKGAKVYFVQHGVFPPSDDDPLNLTYRLPLKKITISKSLGEVLAGRFGDPNIPIIPNSVDTDLFNAPPREKNDAFTIGLLYSPAPLKGVADALSVWRKVAAAVPDARLVVFGAKSPTADLPLPDGAMFTLSPEQASIKSIYQQCDAWLCASHAEGFHLPPLEAMACRCPVVSTEVGGPLDIIKDRVNGYLAKVGDADDLARKLIRIAGLSKDDWRSMSDAAYATATSYNWNDATTLFEKELYRIVEDRTH